MGANPRQGYQPPLPPPPPEHPRPEEFTLSVCPAYGTTGVQNDSQDTEYEIVDSVYHKAS